MEPHGLQGLLGHLNSHWSNEFFTVRHPPSNIPLTCKSNRILLYIVLLKPLIGKPSETYTHHSLRPSTDFNSVCSILIKGSSVIEKTNTIVPDSSFVRDAA